MAVRMAREWASVDAAGGYPGLPWDRWTDGQWHVLRRGPDFMMEVESFRELLRKGAKHRGLRAVTHVDAVEEIVLAKISAPREPAPPVVCVAYFEDDEEDEL